MAVTIGSQYYPRNSGDKMRIVKILSVLAILLVLERFAVAEGGQFLLNAAGATSPIRFTPSGSIIPPGARERAN